MAHWWRSKGLSLFVQVVMMAWKKRATLPLNVGCCSGVS
jgi:hypothetical protein